MKFSSKYAKKKNFISWKFHGQISRDWNASNPQQKKTVHIPRGIMQISDSTMANLNASQEI